MSTSESSGGTIFGLPARVCECGCPERLRTSLEDTKRREEVLLLLSMAGWRLWNVSMGGGRYRSQALMLGLLRKCNSLETQVSALDEGKQWDEKEIAMLQKERKKLGNEIDHLEKRNGMLKKKNKKLYVVLSILILVLCAMLKASIGEGGSCPTKFKQLD